MKLKFFIPSFSKRISARLSVNRIICLNFRFKALRGWSRVINTKKTLCNWIYNKNLNGRMFKTAVFLFAVIFVFSFSFSLSSCTDNEGQNNKSTYVKPSIDYKGRYRKGHVRMPSSTKKDAIKNQNKSRYYYQTRGKYRRKNKRN